MKTTLAIVALLGLAQINAVNLRCDGDDDDHSCEVFTPNMDGQVDGSYERVVTPRFDGDSDDIFMRSMIKTYANEKKNKDGSPSGSFIMTEAATRAAASEVLETHKGLAGAAKEAYLQIIQGCAGYSADLSLTGPFRLWSNLADDMCSRAAARGHRVRHLSLPPVWEQFLYSILGMDEQQSNILVRHNFTNHTSTNLLTNSEFIKFSKA